MAKDKFMFFQNFKETADKLPPELRLKFYDAITDYVFYEKESDDPVISALVNAFRPSLTKEDGRKNNGGNHNPKGVNQYTKSGQSLVNSGQSRSIPLETETETETEIETRKESIEKLTSPSLQDVLTFAKQQNDMAGCGGFPCSKVMAEEFWSHYQANGWIVGNESRTPVRDWQAKLRQWCARERQRGTQC